MNIILLALTEGTDACRLYATRFLGVLVRCRTANVAQWGIKLLVDKLFDDSELIATAAVDILDDACDDKMNLEAVVCEFRSKLPVQSRLCGGDDRTESDIGHNNHQTDSHEL